MRRADCRQGGNFPIEAHLGDQIAGIESAHGMRDDIQPGSAGRLLYCIELRCQFTGADGHGLDRIDSCGKDIVALAPERRAHGFGTDER